MVLVRISADQQGIIAHSQDLVQIIVIFLYPKEMFFF